MTRTPRQQVLRSRRLTVRVADGVGAWIVGWLIGAKVAHWVSPAANRVEKDLWSFTCAVVCCAGGLFLVDLAIGLERRTRAAGWAISGLRFCAAAVVGSALLREVSKGWFGIFAVLSAVFALMLVFRALDVPQATAEAPQTPVEGMPEKVGRAAVLGDSDSAVLAPGVRGKLDEFMAMIASGVSVGFLVGCARYVLIEGGVDLSGLKKRLFQASTVLVAVGIRFVWARLVQGRRHLKGWRAGLLGADGVVVGSVLAISMSGRVLPLAEYVFYPLRHQPFWWIPAGLVIGFFGSLVVAFLVEAVIATIKMNICALVRFGRAVGIGPAAMLSSSVLPVVPPAANTPEGPREAGKEDVAPRRLRSRPTTGGRSVIRVGCACLGTPLALLGALIFLYAQRCQDALFPAEPPLKKQVELPAGCPPRCNDITIEHYDLSGSDFSEANFAGSTLKNVWMPNAKLHGADFNHALLFGTALQDSDLSGADFSSAQFRVVTLVGARLKNTNFRGADLRGAVLVDLDFSTAELEGADLRDATYSRGTVWPPDFDVGKAGMDLWKEWSPP